MAEANWYWAQGDQQNGPVAGSAIARLVADGKLGADDLIWKDGMAEWIAVKKVPALTKYLKTPVGTAAVNAAPAAVIGYAPGPVDSRSVHQFVRDPNGSVACPHCSVANPTDAQWCESCGMALPIPSAGPRIVDGAAFASTVAGQQLQSEELQKQSKRGATALMWVAIIQTVVLTFFVAVTAPNPRMLPIAQQPMAWQYGVVAVVFWGLFLWARQQPLPAAIVGLVLYSTLKVITFVMIISQASDNSTPHMNGGIGNSGIGWIDIVIIAVLCQAISAGLKYRKMQSNAGDNAN